MKIECGRSICRQNGKLNVGTRTCGDHRSTEIVVNCKGERVALIHNHPSGNPNPSPQDLTACRKLQIPHVCVETEKHGITCHKVKH